MLVVVSEFGAYRGLGLKLRVILYGYVVIAHQHYDQITGKRKARTMPKERFHSPTHTHIYTTRNPKISLLSPRSLTPNIFILTPDCLRPTT